jgi:hypothetical protein
MTYSYNTKIFEMYNILMFCICHQAFTSHLLLSRVLAGNHLFMSLKKETPAITLHLEQKMTKYGQIRLITVKFIKKDTLRQGGPKVGREGHKSAGVD